MADDLLWPAGDPETDLSPAEREGVEHELRSLLPASLRLGTGAAVSRLASRVVEGERPVAIVSGTLEGQKFGSRRRLVLVTDRRLVLADLKGGEAAAWRWQDVDTFSTRNSNPASYALDWMTLSVMKSTSCMYIVRLKDGTRIPLANIAPQRRGFVVGRRIAWYVRKSRLSAGALAESDKVMRLAGALGRSLKAKTRAASRLPSGDPVPDANVLDETVTDDDVLSHLAALHEAGILTEEEVRRKAASLDAGD